MRKAAKLDIHESRFARRLSDDPSMDYFMPPAATRFRPQPKSNIDSSSLATLKVTVDFIRVD